MNTQKYLLICIAAMTMALVPQMCVLAFAFEDARPLYVGSRPLGMGNVFTAIADSAEAGFWNPAGLVQWQGVKVSGSAKASDRESYAFDSKCVAYSYRDTAFFWGNKIAFRVEGTDTPDFTYYSFARKLSPHVAMGSSVKFKRRHPCEYYQFFGYSPGYDLGVLWKPNDRSSGGMLIQNMGDGKRWISAVTSGLAHRLPNGAMLSVDITALFDAGFLKKSLSKNFPQIVPQTVTIWGWGFFKGLGRVALEPHVGWEWQATRWVALRVGMSDGHPTAGAGLRLSTFWVDYAWIRDTGGSAHFLSGQVDL